MNYHVSLSVCLCLSVCLMISVTAYYSLPHPFLPCYLLSFFLFVSFFLTSFIPSSCTHTDTHMYPTPLFDDSLTSISSHHASLLSLLSFYTPFYTYLLLSFPSPFPLSLYLIFSLSLYLSLSL